MKLHNLFEDKIPEEIRIGEHVFKRNHKIRATYFTYDLISKRFCNKDYTAPELESALTGFHDDDTFTTVGDEHEPNANKAFWAARHYSDQVMRDINSYVSPNRNNGIRIGAALNTVISATDGTQVIDWNEYENYPRNWPPADMSMCFTAKIKLAIFSFNAANQVKSEMLYRLFEQEDKHRLTIQLGDHTFNLSGNKYTVYGTSYALGEFRDVYSLVSKKFYVNDHASSTGFHDDDTFVSEDPALAAANEYLDLVVKDVKRLHDQSRYDGNGSVPEEGLIGLVDRAYIQPFNVQGPSQYYEHVLKDPSDPRPYFAALVKIQ